MEAASEVTKYALELAKVYTEEKSDKMGLRHDYSRTYARLFIGLRGVKDAKVAEIGVFKGSSIRAMLRMLKGVSIYGLDISPVEVEGATVVSGDGYSKATWKDLPTDFDIIIDDGSHNIVDMVRGIPVLMAHLKAGGRLLIEDIECMRDVNTLMHNFPGGEFVDTREHGAEDDLSIIWTKR